MQRYLAQRPHEDAGVFRNTEYPLEDQGNAKPTKSPNDLHSGIFYEHEPNRRLIVHGSLCEIQQRPSLDEDPKYTNQLESRQTVSLTPPTIISDDLRFAQRNSIQCLKMNYCHLNQNELKRQLRLPSNFSRSAADYFNNHPRAEQQEHQDSTISDYSSSSSSPFLQEMFSLKNSSDTDINSTAMLDEEETTFYCALTEQVSGSDLVNEFARFTMSCLVAWTENRGNSKGSYPHDSESHEGQNCGRCKRGNGQKRIRENGHNGGDKNHQKGDGSGEEDNYNEKPGSCTAA